MKENCRTQAMRRGTATGVSKLGGVRRAPMESPHGEGDTPHDPAQGGSSARAILEIVYTNKIRLQDLIHPVTP